MPFIGMTFARVDAGGAKMRQAQQNETAADQRRKEARPQAVLAWERAHAERAEDDAGAKRQQDKADAPFLPAVVVLRTGVVRAHETRPISLSTAVTRVSSSVR